MSLAFAAEEYPPWQTVYYWFRLWRKDGTLEHIRQVLVNRVREQSVRSAEANAVSLIPKRLKQPPMLIAIAI